MPFKSTKGKSVSKLIKTYRNRDMALTSPVVTADTELPSPVAVQYLIVGGGGGGGFGNAGGAGGGGYRTNYTTPTPDCPGPNTGGGGNGIEPAISPVLVCNTAYPLYVGAGGTGGSQPIGPSPWPGGATATRGEASWFGDVGSEIISLGGSEGGQGPTGGNGGATGASGGGGGYPGRPGGAGANYPGPLAQGYPGGSGAPESGGGGGGASQSGTAGPGGTGGDGVKSYITGSCLWYGGGGGGGATTPYPHPSGPQNPGQSPGPGGEGGGGSGGNTNPGTNATSGNPGTVNTGGGGGGGGGGYPGSAGGLGGKGIVVLRVPDAFNATFSPGVTASTITSVSGFVIYKVTNTSDGDQTVTFGVA